MTKAESDVLLVPPEKFTAQLRARAKAQGHMLRRVDWIEKIWSTHEGVHETSTYSITPRRARSVATSLSPGPTELRMACFLTATDIRRNLGILPTA